MSWCSDAPEDEAISLFAGLLPNPDVRLSRFQFVCNQEKLNHEQLVCEIYDVSSKMIDLVYPFKEVQICMSESFLSDDLLTQRSLGVFYLEYEKVHY